MLPPAPLAPGRREELPLGLPLLLLEMLGEALELALRDSVTEPPLLLLRLALPEEEAAEEALELPVMPVTEALALPLSARPQLALALTLEQPLEEPASPLLMLPLRLALAVTRTPTQASTRSQAFKLTQPGPEAPPTRSLQPNLKCLTDSE